MAKDTSLYAGKRILVTGGAGFIGANLVKRLIELNADVTVFDNYATGSTSNLYDIEGYTLVEGSILDERLISRIVSNQDIVFHLAVMPISQSFDNVIEMANVNYMGTLKMLEACRNTDTIERFIYTSSVSIYGNALLLPINNSTPYDILTMYAATKLGGEALCDTYTSQFNLPISIVRYSNVYGPRQNPQNPFRGVVGKFLSYALEGKPLKILGDGSDIRDYTYIDDAIEATIRAGIYDNAEYCKLNLGTGIGTSTDELAKIIQSFFPAIDINYVDARDIDLVPKRIVSGHDAREVLSWEPITLKEGIGKMIQQIDNNMTSYVL